MKNKIHLNKFTGLRMTRCGVNCIHNVGHKHAWRPRHVHNKQQCSLCNRVRYFAVKWILNDSNYPLKWLA